MSWPMLSECRRMALWWRETLRRGWGTSTGWLMTGPVPIRRNCEWDGLWILIFTRSRRQLVLDLGRVQKAWTWTVALGGDGSLTIWRRMNKQGGNIEKYADRHIHSRRWVSLSDSGQCEVAWYMVTQSGLCPGLQPIWEERRLNLYPHSSGIWAWRQSWLALCEFPAYPAFLSNFITRGVQKNLSTFFLFLQLKSKLVLRSRGVWNIDKTYGKPDVCQNMLSNVWLAKAEYQELLTQRSLHNQH